MAVSKKVGPFAAMQIKLIQQKLLSERAKNKIYEEMLSMLERIMVKKDVTDTFAQTFPYVPKLKEKPVRKPRPQRKPPSKKQLSALKEGRKILALRRG